MIEPGHRRLSISRSSFYRKPLAESEETLRVFLNAFETGNEARAGIGRWIGYRRSTALGARRQDAR